MTMKTILLSAILSAGALTLTAGPTSAYVACNRGGDCWHTTDRYNYHPGFGVSVHDNNWRWRNHDNYRWREHTGRGYWRNGVWLTF